MSYIKKSPGKREQSQGKSLKLNDKDNHLLVAYQSVYKNSTEIYILYKRCYFTLTVPYLIESSRQVLIPVKTYLKQLEL